MADELRLMRVEPQPYYIESSGRWCWPLPKHALRAGCCTQVVTASREWWEYAPSEAKPHPFAEGVRLRDDVWYWAIPASEPVTRVCADSADGNHVLKQDGPFSVVYCDACGMNKGFRGDISA